MKKPSSRRPRFSLCQSCTSANDQLDYETIAEVGIAADDVEDDDVDARRRRRRRSSVVQALGAHTIGDVYPFLFLSLRFLRRLFCDQNEIMLQGRLGRYQASEEQGDRSCDS